MGGVITKPKEDQEEKKEKKKAGASDSGWFVAPSSDCFELYVNAPFPVSGQIEHAPLHIARVLVDASGSPVRAALYHEDANKNALPKDHVKKADVHDMAASGNFLLEEYDVMLTL